jgi:hypothetical protein
MTDLLKEDRNRGWSAVPEKGPTDEMKRFIRAFRQAKIEKREMPTSITESFNRNCEIRSMGSPQTRRAVSRILAPISRNRGMSMSEGRQLARENGLSFEDVIIARSIALTNGVPMQDTLNSLHMQKIARTVASANKDLLDEKRKALLSDTSPSGRIALREYLDVLAGVRPANPGARPYGFQDQRMESQGQEQDPTQSLRSYPSYDDGEDADEPEEHEKACRCHRSIVQLCSMRHGTEHLKAADAHDRAARRFNSGNSQEARGASYRANHFKESMVS